MTGLTAEDAEAIRLSLRVAAAATLADLPVALALALLLARPRLPGRAVLDAAVHLPLVVPPVATGYALLLAFGRRGPVGALLDRLGLSLSFRWEGAALAAAVMALPLMVRPMRLAIESIDPEVRESALTLGAPPWVRLWRLTLPLAGPGLAAGAVLGFARALGEFGATITFVGAVPGETLTLPAAIYSATQTPGEEGHALLLCGVAAGLAVAAVALAERAAPRPAGAELRPDRSPRRARRRSG